MGHTEQGMGISTSIRVKLLKNPMKQGQGCSCPVPYLAAWTYVHHNQKTLYLIVPAPNSKPPLSPWHQVLVSLVPCLILPACPSQATPPEWCWRPRITPVGPLHATQCLLAAAILSSWVLPLVAPPTMAHGLIWPPIPSTPGSWIWWVVIVLCFVESL